MSEVVRKESGERSRHAVVEVAGVRHVLAAVVPEASGGLREQVRDAAEKVAAVMRAEGAAGVVHQTVFLAADASMPLCRQVLRDHYGAEMPATSYVPQPPCSGKLVAIEAIGLAGEGLVVRRISDQVVAARQGELEWTYAAGAVPRTSAPGVYEKATCALQMLRRMLPTGGARFNEIVRAWFYLGGITEDEGTHQRYHEFNRARTDFYRNLHFIEDRLPQGEHGRAFPASTGIGTAGRGICMSALALASTGPEVVAVPLENPRQTSAYNYARSYSPTSPKFSRGMALCCGEDAVLFVSGTASITHAETRHPGDVVAQTRETLDNIAALIAEENLQRHGLAGAGTSLDGLGVIRVYIKRPEDVAEVRAVVEERLGKIPATYLTADVCRPDLLVEIEGMAFSRSPVTATRPVPAGVPAHPDDGRHGPFCPGTCPELSVCPHAEIPH